MNAVDFEALIEASPVQVWTALPDGSLDYVNGTVTRFFGRSAEQMLGEGWLGFLHPSDVALTMERWTRSIVHGEPYSTEFRLLRAADNQYYWYLAQAEPIRNPAGHIVKWIGTTTDINDLKRTVEVAETRQEMARRERDRLFQIFNFAVAAIVVLTGSDLTIEMMNRKMLEITGRADTVGKSFRDVFAQLAGTGLFERLEEISTTGNGYQIDAMLALLPPEKDEGPTRYWNVVAHAMTEQGEGRKEIVVYFRDVTRFTEADN